MWKKWSYRRYCCPCLIVVRGHLVVGWSRYQIMSGLVKSSSPVPLKTLPVEERCTLNLSRAQTSSGWCSVVVRRGGASSDAVHVT
ncbi:uncharacterized protein TNCV_3499491 [Trichonephila clavipes]|nr:uncharacterized protein TNCV_3499491 [Trichonephila clavipes]